MLNCTVIKEYIKQSVSELFSCHIEDGILTISTPFHYPDGDVIEVFIEDRKDYMLLSDMGETSRFLGTYLFDYSSTKKRKQIIVDVVRSNNLLFEKGTIYAIIKNPRNIVDAIFNMSQAIIRISDLLYTVKSHSSAAFEEEFRTFLEDNNYSYVEDYIVDATSQQYTFDFAIKKNDRVGLVKLLNPPKKPNQKPNISKTVHTWFDIDTSLRTEFPQANRVTVLDDSFYNWSKKDYSLLEKLSMVNFWSNKDRIHQTLKNIS